MADTQVYNIDSSPGLTDIGKTVLPASVQPFDFSRLDKAVEAENDLSNKALATIESNVKDMGRIQDELTGINTPNPYHAAELEAKKKELGVTRGSFASAVNNLDNPMALYDVDRKTKRLMSDPVVQNIKYDNAVLDYFKVGLPKIEDPHLRLRAIDDLDKATKSSDKDAIKNLNLDQYKTIDLETAYHEALDQFAPYIPTTTQKKGPNGETYTEVVNQRDPAMVAKTREYFMKNAAVKNNLLARGYLDANGKPAPVSGGTTWFDDIEKPQLAPITEISNVKGAVGGSSKYQYQLSPDMKSVAYTPNVVNDKDTGTAFDLGVIAGRETGGRAPDNVVHWDPSPIDSGINIGAYSFHGGLKGPAKDYLNTLTEQVVTNPAALAALEELKSMDLSNKDNLPKAKAAYAAIEKAIGVDALKGLENQYAIKNYGQPVINYLRGKEGFENAQLTPGEATILMDAAIQWTARWQDWIDEYVKSDTNESIGTFITKKRIEQATKNANDGKYGQNGAALAQSMNDQAVQVWQATMGATQPPAAGAPTSPGTQPIVKTAAGTVMAPDLSQFNQDIDPGVAAAQDSVVAQQAQASVNFWRNKPQQ